ncbi:MAG: ABC transporter ATP-binding protein [Bacteroidales bacterium]
MIKAKDITKSYGDLKVLKGVDLEVRKSEIVTIVGPSGAGKTTLLQILGTLDRPDEGSVECDGVLLNMLNARQLARFRNEQIGFVFQFHQLLPEFTALENVCIPAYIGGKSKQQAEKRAGELLGFLGLDLRLEHKPSELSGGEQQRVAVARALVNSPKVILADEPSGNLDTENKKELHKLFFDLRDEFGQTIVIVTHDRELSGMSDRKIEIKDGVIFNG